MKRGNQICAVILRIFCAFKKRPLVVPAIIAVLAVYVFTAVRPVGAESSNIAALASVRHIEYNLDGSASYELRTTEYGRLLYNGTIQDDLKPGGIVFIEGYLKVYGPPTNPGEFDYSAYLKQHGIAGVVYPEVIRPVRPAPMIMQISSKITSFFYEVRKFAVSVFDQEDKGLAAALFLGDTTLLDDELTRSFRLSNCSHLLAVSGTHFTGFLLVLGEVFSRAHIKKKYSAGIYILFCIMTGMLTGWPESVTRACVVSICSFLSRDYISGLSLAAVMLVVKDPYSPMSTGFLMSFAASLSIKLFARRLDVLLSKTGMPGVMRDVINPVIAATIGMMPFWGRTCYYFSLVHLFTQVAASVLATAACVFFVPTVITGLPMACSLIFKLLRLLMALCSSVSLEGASSSGLSPMFIYSAFALICLYLMPETILRRVLIIPSAAVVMVSVGLMIGSYLIAPEVTVVFIDVGQGDSCLIMSQGRSLLIDGGVEAEGRYAVSSVLDHYGISSVDIAVATHEDEDHIGGLEYLNSVGRIDTLLTCYDLSSGDEIMLTDEVTLYCLWPHQVVDGGNEDSVVLRFEYNDFSILFTGDIGFESEQALIEEGADIDADVLKVGHHGSAYSTSSVFLECVSPQQAVISVVANSPYGHPAPATIERLEEYGCQIRRTDHEGAILYLLD